MPISTHYGSIPIDWSRCTNHTAPQHKWHLANWKPGRYGWDYPTLCGKTLHYEDSDVKRTEEGEGLDARFVCKRCLQVLKKAQRAAARQTANT